MFIGVFPFPVSSTMDFVTISHSTQEVKLLGTGSICSLPAQALKTTFRFLPLGSLQLASFHLSLLTLK